MENSRFKIQDPGFQKSLPEKQQLMILYYRGRGGTHLGCGHNALSKCGYIHQRSDLVMRSHQYEAEVASEEGNLQEKGALTSPLANPKIHLKGDSSHAIDNRPQGSTGCPRVES